MRPTLSHQALLLQLRLAQPTLLTPSLRLLGATRLRLPLSAFEGRPQFPLQPRARLHSCHLEQEEDQEGLSVPGTAAAVKASGYAYRHSTRLFAATADGGLRAALFRDQSPAERCPFSAGLAP